MTYYFNLHRIYDDGSMDIHVEKVKSMESGVRQLAPELADLPGGTGIWHGYILADSPEQAKAKVAEAY